MLTHPTHDRLIALGLTGMAKALEDQRRQPDVATLPFEERLAMMIDREAIERENKRLERRLKAASLRQSAIVEDIDHKAPRGLDRALFQKLIAGEWIARHQNLLVIGPTGVGKSWIAEALNASPASPRGFFFVPIFGQVLRPHPSVASGWSRVSTCPQRTHRKTDRSRRAPAAVATRTCVIVPLQYRQGGVTGWSWSIQRKLSQRNFASLCQIAHIRV